MHTGYNMCMPVDVDKPSKYSNYFPRGHLITWLLIPVTVINTNHPWDHRLSLPTSDILRYFPTCLTVRSYLNYIYFQSVTDLLNLLYYTESNKRTLLKKYRDKNIISQDSKKEYNVNFLRNGPPYKSVLIFSKQNANIVLVEKLNFE